MLDRTQRLIEIARGVSSAAIADALDAEGVWSCLSPQLRRLSQTDQVLFGQAYTVHWAPTRKTSDIRQPGPSTWSEVADFLAPAIEYGEGRIYVAGGGPIITDMALAGGLSCTYFQKAGFAGIVLGGAVRDAAVVGQSAIPIVASNFIPADTQGAYCVASAGTQTTIESVTVRTGDWIFSDMSGTVAVPDEIAVPVLERAKIIERRENQVMERIQAGEPLPQILADEDTHI